MCLTVSLTTVPTVSPLFAARIYHHVLLCIVTQIPWYVAHINYLILPHMTFVLPHITAVAHCVYHTEHLLCITHKNFYVSHVTSFVYPYDTNTYCVSHSTLYTPHIASFTYHTCHLVYTTLCMYRMFHVVQMSQVIDAFNTISLVFGTHQTILFTLHVQYE